MVPGRGHATPVAAATIGKGVLPARIVMVLQSIISDLRAARRSILPPRPQRAFRARTCLNGSFHPLVAVRIYDASRWHPQIMYAISLSRVRWNVTNRRLAAVATRRGGSPPPATHRAVPIPQQAAVKSARKLGRCRVAS